MTWTAREYLYGIVLFSAVIALFYLAIGDLAVTYDRTDIVDSKFSENYDKLTDNKQMADSMLGATYSSSGLSFLDTVEVVLTSTISVIKLTFNSLTTFSGQLLHVGDDFGVPTQVIKIIASVFLMLITIGIVLIVINAVNKTEKL